LEAPARPKKQFFRNSASLEAPAHPKMRFFRNSALLGLQRVHNSDFNVFSERSLPSSRNEMSRWAMNFSWR